MWAMVREKSLFLIFSFKVWLWIKLVNKFLIPISYMHIVPEIQGDLGVSECFRTDYSTHAA